MTDAGPDWHDKHLWQIQPVRDVCLILGVILLLWVGHLLSTVTVPLLIALGLAYLFEPVIHRLTRLHRWVTRTRVVACTLALLAAVMILALALLVPFAIGQAKHLVANTGRYAAALRDMSRQEWVPEDLRQTIGVLSAPLVGDSTEDAPSEEPAGAGAPEAVVDEERVRQIVAAELADRRGADAGSEAFRLLGMGGRKVISTLGHVVHRTVDLGLSLFLIAFFFFFFSTTFPEVKAFFLSCLPEAGKERNLELLTKMNQAISGFVRGRLTIALILAMIYAVGWTICGVPSGALLGILTGVACLIPYLAGVGLPLAWGLLLMQLYGSGADSIYLTAEGGVAWHWLLLLPAIPWVLAQLCDDYLLSPIIQGRATQLGPVSIVVAVIGGGVLAGLYGMLLAIPVAACIRIVVIDVLAPRLREWLAGRRKDPLPVG